jgi:hypothetical protein
MQGALDTRAKLASPARKEDEERDEKRLSKADRTARPTSSATFSTASTQSRLQVGYLDDHQIDGFEKDGVVSADYAGSSKSCLTRRSHYSYPENFSVARLDLLGLREHRDGIGSQQLHCR